MRTHGFDAACAHQLWSHIHGKIIYKRLRAAFGNLCAFSWATHTHIYINRNLFKSSAWTTIENGNYVNSYTICSIYTLCVYLFGKMNCEFVTDQSTKYETRRKQPRAKWHYTIWPQSIALYNVSECGLGRCCFGIQNHPQRRKTTNVSKKHTLQVWNWYSASALALS